MVEGGGWTPGRMVLTHCARTRQLKFFFFVLCYGASVGLEAAAISAAIEEVTSGVQPTGSVPALAAASVAGQGQPTTVPVAHGADASPPPQPHPQPAHPTSRPPASTHLGDGLESSRQLLEYTGNLLRRMDAERLQQDRATRTEHGAQGSESPPGRERTPPAMATRESADDAGAGNHRTSDGSGRGKDDDETGEAREPVVSLAELANQLDFF